MLARRAPGRLRRAPGSPPCGTGSQTRPTGRCPLRSAGERQSNSFAASLTSCPGACQVVVVHVRLTLRSAGQWAAAGSQGPCSPGFQQWIIRCQHEISMQGAPAAPFRAQTGTCPGAGSRRSTSARWKRRCWGTCTGTCRRAVLVSVGSTCALGLAGCVWGASDGGQQSREQTASRDGLVLADLQPACSSTPCAQLPNRSRHIAAQSMCTTEWLCLHQHAAAAVTKSSQSAQGRRCAAASWRRNHP